MTREQMIDEAVRRYNRRSDVCESIAQDAEDMSIIALEDWWQHSVAGIRAEFRRIEAMQAIGSAWSG